MEIYMKSFLRILAWLPAIAVMALIFMFSSQDADTSNDTSSQFVEIITENLIPNYDKLTSAEKAELNDELQHIVRKTAHGLIFLVLAATVFFALACSSVKPPLAFFLSWLIASAYAVTDEIHQLYVPGRACMVTDMLIDSSGALVGALISLAVLLGIIRRRKRRSVLK